MTDIKQAIQELREAGLFTPPPYQSDGPHTGLYIGGHHHTYWTIHNGDTGVAIIIMPDEEKTKAVIAEREATTRFVVESCNSALASSVKGGTVDGSGTPKEAVKSHAYQQCKCGWEQEYGDENLDICPACKSRGCWNIVWDSDLYRPAAKEILDLIGYDVTADDNGFDAEHTVAIYLSDHYGKLQEREGK